MTSPVTHPLTVELGKASKETARKVLGLLDLLEQGLIHRDDLPYLAASLTELGANQSAALVLRELAHETAVATGSIPAMPTVSREALDPAKVVQAVTTVLNGPEDGIPVRLERLVRGAVSEAAQKTRGRAIRDTGIFRGWTRGIDSGSCELCVWWWREGRVWPKDHVMPTHAGCDCVQVPAFSTKRLSVSREARAASAERRLAMEQADE